MIADRGAADLLLAVEGEAYVHREGPLLGELPHRLDEEERVPLVVGDAARVEAPVALRELERGRLPEVEGVRRLHVEVRVAEDRRGRLRALRRCDLADHEGPSAPRHELRAAAARADHARDPLGRVGDVRRVGDVGADRRDRDQLGELVVQLLAGRCHGRGV